MMQIKFKRWQGIDSWFENRGEFARHTPMARQHGRLAVASAKT